MSRSERELTKQRLIITLLVERLGGEVKIPLEEFKRAMAEGRSLGRSSWDDDVLTLSVVQGTPASKDG